MYNSNHPTINIYRAAPAPGPDPAPIFGKTHEGVEEVIGGLEPPVGPAPAPTPGNDENEAEF